MCVGASSLPTLRHMPAAMQRGCLWCDESLAFCAMAGGSTAAVRVLMRHDVAGRAARRLPPASQLSCKLRSASTVLQPLEPETMVHTTGGHSSCFRHTSRYCRKKGPGLQTNSNRGLLLGTPRTKAVHHTHIGLLLHHLCCCGCCITRPCRASLLGLDLLLATCALLAFAAACCCP